MIFRSSRIYLGLSSPFSILSLAYLLNKIFLVFWHYMGLPASLWDYQHHAITSRTIQQLQGPFSDFQHPGTISHLHYPSITFSNLQGLSSATRDYQLLPWTINNIQQPSEPSSNIQVLSVTTKIYQHLPETISHLHHPSMTFSNFQGLSSTTRVYQHLPGTISSIQNPSEPFSNFQVLSVTSKIYQ